MPNIEYTQLHAHYHANKLTLAGTDDGAFTRSLTSARVEMNPHQVNAALFALKSPLAKGVLLADEVGLGNASTTAAFMSAVFEPEILSVPAWRAFQS